MYIFHLGKLRFVRSNHLPTVTRQVRGEDGPQVYAVWPQGQDHIDKVSPGILHLFVAGSVLCSYYHFHLSYLPLGLKLYLSIFLANL